MSLAEIGKNINWISQYGALAIALVLILIIAPAIYLTRKNELIATAAVSGGLMLLLTLGALDLLNKYWPEALYKTSYLPGQVQGVPDTKPDVTVWVGSDRDKSIRPYTIRESPSGGLYNIPFVFLERIPKCILVVFSFSAAGDEHKSEHTESFLVPVTDGDADKHAQFALERIQGDKGAQLRVTKTFKNRSQEELPDLDPAGNGATCAKPHPTESANLFGLTAKASDQQAMALSDWESQLQSSDPLTRRITRIDLAELGSAAFPIIDQLLDRKDNYRLQLGAVVALGIMPDEIWRQAPPALVNKVRSLLFYKDKTMRDNVIQALRQPLSCYQEKDSNKPGDQRYLVLCTWSQEQCESIRGPNKNRGITQSPCVALGMEDLEWNTQNGEKQLSWSYKPGGYGGSWYSYSPASFQTPFPKLPN